MKYPACSYKSPGFRKSTGFHVVDVSPWPIVVSSAVLGLACSLVGLFNMSDRSMSLAFLIGCVSLLLLSAIRWWSDIVLESTYLGRHTSLVVKTLRMGMFLFILSEVFFFVGFFWAFFYVSIGEISMNEVGQWPPVGVVAINPWEVPLLNTIILLSTGLSVTVAHKAISIHNKSPVFTGFVVSGISVGKSQSTLLCIIMNSSLVVLISRCFHWSFYKNPTFFKEKSVEEEGYDMVFKQKLLGKVCKASMKEDLFFRGEIAGLSCSSSYWNSKVKMGEAARKKALMHLLLTILGGSIFSYLQFKEYYWSSFSIADSVYGSSFYLMTGFHGVHVLVGTIFLSVVLLRTWRYHFCQYNHYFGFDAAVWYWHFVDVVWILLYVVVYIWGY
uniref:Cytochrome c oxidase subunit 3 n=1 Tax=Raeta sp. TaxID=3067663 RepID=A0AA49X6N0_9BIVA|nr:cytochrome c oxidase subunit 3 [Raeta sp.]